MEKIVAGNGDDLLSLMDDGTDEELVALQTEHAKLKHRYAILQRVRSLWPHSILIPF